MYVHRRLCHKQCEYIEISLAQSCHWLCVFYRFSHLCPLLWIGGTIFGAVQKGLSGSIASQSLCRSHALCFYDLIPAGAMGMSKTGTSKMAWTRTEDSARNRTVTWTKARTRNKARTRSFIGQETMCGPNSVIQLRSPHITDHMIVISYHIISYIILDYLIFYYIILHIAWTIFFKCYASQ